MDDQDNKKVEEKEEVKAEDKSVETPVEKTDNSDKENEDSDNATKKDSESIKEETPSEKNESAENTEEDAKDSTEESSSKIDDETTEVNSADAKAMADKEKTVKAEDSSEENKTQDGESSTSEEETKKENSKPQEDKDDKSTDTKPDNDKKEDDKSGDDSSNEEVSEEIKRAKKLLSEDDPNDPAKWYIIHTYSGHENKVSKSIQQRVQSLGYEKKIFDIIVPTRNTIKVTQGKKENVKEKIFPGYVLIKMVLDNEAWLLVRTTQGVTSFIGSGNKPTPISSLEVKAIMKFMEEEEPLYKTTYSVGEAVKIVDGPFADFLGAIDNIDEQRGKLKVLVSIFGRETPVELDFLQVTKL